jgi:Sulfotransferase family
LRRLPCAVAARSGIFAIDMESVPSIPQAALYDHEALLWLATASTGLDDFGPEKFHEPLKRLLDSLKNEARLTPQGAQNEHLRLLKSLTDRLQIQAAINAHPEILQEPIDRPLVITGLWRTGSTKLQRVIAKDSRWRCLPLWEAMHPVPFRGEAPGDPSPRIDATRAMVDGFRSLVPQAYAAHPVLADEPEEEIGPFSSQSQIQSTASFGTTHTPGYMNWVIQQPMTEAYRWLRKTFQYLQWQRGTLGNTQRKRWVLKAPFHLGFLDDLYQVFPDAAVVQCHRRPLVDIAASLTTLIHDGRAMSSSPGDLRAEGQELLGYFAAMLDKQMAQRRVGASDRVIDVDYRDIHHHCAAVIERIYSSVGMPYTPDVVTLVNAWEHDNPQHLHGKFVYSAENVGVTEEAVDRAMGKYAAWLKDFSAGYKTK